MITYSCKHIVVIVYVVTVVLMTAASAAGNGVQCFGLRVRPLVALSGV
jgi:hypothetical protein